MRVLATGGLLYCAMSSCLREVTIDQGMGMFIEMSASASISFLLYPHVEVICQRDNEVGIMRIDKVDTGLPVFGIVIVDGLHEEMKMWKRLPTLHRRGAARE